MIGSFRFMLAIFVVISHTRGYPFERLPDPALSAIVAFFFLSGFLMPATLERNYAGATLASKSLRYLANRVLRIYPTYFFALILFAAALSFNSAAREMYYFDARSILQNVLLLGLNQNEFWGHSQRFIGPAWTLDVEMQYYLIVPILVLLARIAPRFIFSASAPVCLGALYILAFPTGRDALDRSLIPWAPFFMAGFASYWYRSALSSCVNPFFLAGAGILLTGTSVALAFVSLPASHWVFAVALMVWALWILLREQHSSEWDVLLGNLSYPVFILHAAVNTSGVPDAIANALWPGSVLMLALATLILTIPLSVLAELIISRPIDRLRRMLRGSQRGARRESVSVMTDVHREKPKLIGAIENKLAPLE